MNVSDNHCYPILVEQMTYKTQVTLFIYHPIMLDILNVSHKYMFQVESSGTAPTSWQWNEVLDALLQLVSQPVVKSMSKDADTSVTNLDSYCCNLLARVLAELVHQCNAAEVSKMK